MEFEYGDYHVDATPLAEGGRYYARARIYTKGAAGQPRSEKKWSGDLGQCGSQQQAAERGRDWAIQWCDAQRR
jgi:hypothetical protein